MWNEVQLKDLNQGDKMNQLMFKSWKLEDIGNREMEGLVGWQTYKK